jgi:hypothetical protein
MRLLTFILNALMRGSLPYRKRKFIPCKSFLKKFSFCLWDLSFFTYNISERVRISIRQVLVNTIKKIFFQHKHHVLRVQQVTTVQIKELPSSVHQDSSVTKEMGRVLPVLLGISVALQVTNYF